MEKKLTPSLMRRLAIMVMTLVCLCGFDARAQTWTVPRETITYDIMYKWGLINKKAGSVSITTDHAASAGKTFRATLTGATAPWADHLYKVRDTLRATIDSRQLVPYVYEKVALEGGDFNHDNLSFSRKGNVTTSDVIHRRRRKKDTEVTVTTKQLQATGTTLDMLSSFYYMRHLDFDHMVKGETVRLNVFSGSQKEILTIHYDGVTTIKHNDRETPVYHITFTFTSGQGKKTSDNMDAWISTTTSRIPLLLEGKLPVGKVRAVYSGTSF